MDGVKRNRWKSAGEDVLFALNIFILFIVAAGDHIVMSPWLQVAGRMHPLLLHFPIVLIIIAVLISFIRFRDTAAASWLRDFSSVFLLLGTLSAALTVIMGLFLSKEEGYSGNALIWHKWGGLATLWTASLLYWLRRSSAIPQLWGKIAGVVTLAMLIITGHFGADLTHGNNFVMAPVIPAQQPIAVPFDQALVYTHLVQPILKEKCMGCHNTAKAKGALALELPQQLLKGGKGGPALVPGNPALSLLLNRIHLPESDKKHMPPAGKPQLTMEETQLLYYWIKDGAAFNKKATELPAGDSLRLLAETLLQPAASTVPVYDFAPADEKLVSRLSNNYRVIYPIAQHAAPLIVNFYNKDKYNNKALTELLPLKKQIIEIHLQKMPADDETVNALVQFTALRALNLSFTNVKGQTLSKLAQLPHLESLSLSGTKVTLAQLQPLAALASLKKLYLWNTALSPQDMATAAKTFRQATIISGFYDDGSQPLKLSPPLLANEAPIFRKAMQLYLRHPLKGVEIRYTTDGSAPDSVQSPLFKDSLLLENSTTIRAIACKKGWYASEAVQYQFSKTTYTPDSIILITPPDTRYAGDGPATLMDGQIGGVDHGNGKWLGYNNMPLQAMLLFKQSVPAKKITLSMLRNTGAYIFPPAKIEIWAGKDAGHLRLLSSSTPAMAGKDMPTAPTNMDCSFQETNVSCIKVMITPLQHLPAWHPGKGQKGWIFLDEILVN